MRGEGRGAGLFLMERRWNLGKGEIFREGRGTELVWMLLLADQWGFWREWVGRGGGLGKKYSLQ